MSNILNSKSSISTNAVLVDLYNGRLSPNASVIALYIMNQGSITNSDGLEYIEFSARQFGKLLNLNSPDAVRKYVNESIESGYVCCLEQKGLVNQYRFKIEKVLEDYGI